MENIRVFESIHQRYQIIFIYIYRRERCGWSQFTFRPRRDQVNRKPVGFPFKAISSLLSSPLHLSIPRNHSGAFIPNDGDAQRRFPCAFYISLRRRLNDSLQLTLPVLVRYVDKTLRGNSAVTPESHIEFNVRPILILKIEERKAQINWKNFDMKDCNGG